MPHDPKATVAERWKKVEELYEAALEADPGRRPALLDERCQGDSDLRKEVKSLLHHGENAGRFLDVPDAAKPLASGQRVLHYEVQEKIGEGGMGAVYKALDTRLRRLVVLKVLPPEYASDPERQERLLREARAASALNHANIVAIYQAEVDQSVSFIAKEFVDGKTLRELVPSKGMPLARAVDYAVQIASAVSKAMGQA